jgi:hypothetical protein
MLEIDTLTPVFFGSERDFKKLGLGTISGSENSIR